MLGKINEAYHSMLHNILDENRFVSGQELSRREEAVRVRKSDEELLAELDQQGRSFRERRVDTSPVKLALCCSLLCSVVTAAFFSLNKPSLASATAPKPEVIAPERAQVTTQSAVSVPTSVSATEIELKTAVEELKLIVHKNEESTQQRNKDIELIKQILKGLVEAEKSQNQAKVVTETRVVPATITHQRIRVVSKKAKLFESPLVTSKIIGEVDRDTVLLVRETKEQWISVETPLGKPSWIQNTEINFVG